MTESTSPSLSRSPNKLEYTSSINTNHHLPPPISTYHSSFDTLSEPRDCDRLVGHNQSTISGSNDHRLKIDLPRLDLNSQQRSMEGRKKLLTRTESISLPTTPTEQFSPPSSLSADYQYHRSILAGNSLGDDDIGGADNNNGDEGDDDDDDDDDDDEEQPYPFLPSSDFMLTVPKSHSTGPCKEDSNRNNKTSLRPTSSSSSSGSTSSQTSSPTSIHLCYGVDWSDRARPTSHCWFPYKSQDITSSQACAFFSCKDPKSNHATDFIQCESCLVIVHTHHLVDLPSTCTTTNYVPPCRPSFSESTQDKNNQNKPDRHFWSHVSLLTKPCALCRRKSISSSLFSANRPSTMPSLDMMNKGVAAKYSFNNSSNLKTSATSSGYQCLWCSRSYHRWCWNQVADQDEKNKCDYGAFRNIIVRPQWLRRIPGPPVHFRAQYRFHYQDDFEDSNHHYTPLLLFINKRSGGQSGEKIYRKLLHLLNPRQVFLLENDATILQALEVYSSLPNIRICVFGGDGTVGWVLSRLAELYPSLNNPPVSVCPLGTGNDLSRVLSWGEQYDPKRLLSTLIQIPHSYPIALDRWQVSIEQLDSIPSSTNPRESTSSVRTFLSLLNHPKFVRDTTRASYQNNRSLPNTRFINYMSFGLDAAIALEFHDRRKRDPRKFSSPLKNKLMYLNESRKYLNDFARSKMWNLGSYIRLICDGEDLTDSIRTCHTLLVLNIPGYASGTNPWGKSSSNTAAGNPSQTIIIQKDSDSFEQISTSSIEIIDLPGNTHEVYELISFSDCPGDQINLQNLTTYTTVAGRFDRQDFGDKKIEVVGLSTTHMATIHMGFRGTRIAQCSQLRIEICCPMTAQMDGEPFYLPESVAVNITHAGQVLVLRNDNR